ncbi:MAG: GGDEF domain-containing protein [Proteobacteria bacterium]|nr:GGDEF domain-containing protein [Pseudomonadota bacterium]
MIGQAANAIGMPLADNRSMGHHFIEKEACQHAAGQCNPYIHEAQLKRIAVRIIDLFNNWQKGALLVFCFSLTVFIGLARYYTGTEYALSVFYLFPITIAAWHSGFAAGFFISVSSACSWLIADLILLDTFSKPLVPYINETFRLIVFLFMAYLVSELKNACFTQEQLARTDALTGLLNRRAFLEYMEIEFNKVKRFGHVVSIIYIDVDDFKRVNDVLGHSGGDRLLCVIAGIIQSNIRIIDVSARLGGDEFSVLLPQTDADAAFLVATKIQKKLFNVKLGHNWHPSVSMGVATYECLPESIHDMIKKADTLMYAAKQSGKNTINRQVMKDM